ncbi:hypothetical protein THRCLA_23179 [Thraustotheca clavata]|uniref:Uncharacterized protein n=1 Tax=Thraustotheca clavata TaxID=74557 RepID=A0A1V9YBJ7_9STRA|nr:hypothetical protein THRCLA_23179 [Thraustotheca clavata]
MFPPQQETMVPAILPQLASNRPVGCVDVEGGWYTMEQKGGQRLSQLPWPPVQFPSGSQPNTDSYHYSNKDDSYYKNSNGSTNYNNGQGHAKYTPPPPVNYTRDNNSTLASVDSSFVFAQGGFKIVYKGEYVTGERCGEPCVCKEFKTGSVDEDSIN